MILCLAQDLRYKGLEAQLDIETVMEFVKSLYIIRRFLQIWTLE